MYRFQHGERSALTVLVRRHQSGLYNYAFRQLGSKALAEEAVQEVFVRVAESAPDFKHQARFSTWVYTILRNFCVDVVRKESLRKHASLDQPRRGEGDEGPTLGEVLGDRSADVERTATSNELSSRLERAVAALPQEQRDVFLMREISNLPFKEIAEVIGISENTVKSRMRYALERLQEALSEYEELARALK